MACLVILPFQYPHLITRHPSHHVCLGNLECIGRVQTCKQIERTRDELKLLPRPAPIRFHQIAIGKLSLWILGISCKVGWRAVGVEVVLLYILAVIALTVGQAEQTLLQDRVPAVPQGEREAELLLVVGDPGQAVLSPVAVPLDFVNSVARRASRIAIAGRAQ